METCGAGQVCVHRQGRLGGNAREVETDLLPIGVGVAAGAVHLVDPELLLSRRLHWAECLVVGEDRARERGDALAQQ